jgi:DNA-binding transcriptional LysR family regulator
MRAADVAIWTAEPQQSDLIRRPLFTMKIHAFASAQYIRRSGAPQTLEDLDDHAIVSYSGTPAVHLSAIRWLETAGLNGKAPRKPTFAANSIVAMKYAIRAGIGIGLVPDYLTEEETELVPVLRDVELPTVPIYFVFPEELRTAKKVQVFRDFLVAKARQWKF